MKTFLELENGYEHFLESAKKASTKFAKRHKVRIVIDDTLLSEAYERAIDSLRFHTTKAPNHYKQLAHLTHWVRKEKPFRVAPLGKEIKFLADAIHNVKMHLPDHFKTALTGFDFIEMAEQLPETQFTETLKYVNEIIAIEVALRLYLMHEKELHKKKFSMKKASNKFASYHGLLINSLKKHTYSARGMATTFEWALRHPKTMRNGESPFPLDNYDDI